MTPSARLFSKATDIDNIKLHTCYIQQKLTEKVEIVGIPRWAFSLSEFPCLSFWFSLPLWVLSYTGINNSSLPWKLFTFCSQRHKCFHSWTILLFSLCPITQLGEPALQTLDFETNMGQTWGKGLSALSPVSKAIFSVSSNGTGRFINIMYKLGLFFVSAGYQARALHLSGRLVLYHWATHPAWSPYILRAHSC